MLRKSLRPLAAAASCLLFACGGDDGTGPGSDQPPTVTIQEVLLEGADHREVKVTGLATDDRGLDSLRFSVNGFLQFTRPVFGKESTFEFSAPGQQPGQGSVEVIAFDDGGQSRSATAPFEVLEPSPTIEGKVFLVKGGEMNPATGKLFCVEEVCDEVEADGSVWLEGLQWRSGGFRIHPIEGANPEFLVVPRKNRLEKNLVNFTNTDARGGRVPLDTALVDGVNERKYIFFADDPVPIQDIVDNHLGPIVGENRVDFIVDANVDVADTLLGIPGENFKYVWDDETSAANTDTLTIAFALRWGDLPPETVDSIAVWSERGIDRAQDCWSLIWDEPHRYGLEFITFTGMGFFYALPGNVVLFPSRDPLAPEYIDFGFSNTWVGFNRLRLVTPLAHPAGIGYLERLLDGGLAALMIGSPHIPTHTFNTYMSLFDDPSDLETGWTATDQQACLFLSAYDYRTRFTLSEGY